MSIPIKNIYYLLCYAWDALDQKELVSAGSEDFKDLSDLFAKVLANGITHQLKRGLDQGYRCYEETTRSIRGKLLLGPSVQKMLLPQAQAACAFDERTANILHNQILRSTMRRLLLNEELDSSIREELELVFRRFPPVDDISLNTRHFDKVQLTRNNRSYGFLLSVCRVIHDHWLVTEEHGPITFQDFIRDEHRMRLLFQAFVLNFFIHETPDYRVFPEGIEWHVTVKGPDDHYLPKMTTDVCLVHRKTGKKTVVETKFKGQVFQHYHGTDKVHSENLYQLYAYLKNIEAKGGANEKCSAILLYAAADAEADLQFQFPGHDIRVRTLDLTQDWRDIESSLFALVS
jgi:5-methylcytosine-specific restriction enzyme subunit McrC